MDGLGPSADDDADEDDDDEEDHLSVWLIKDSCLGLKSDVCASSRCQRCILTNELRSAEQRSQLCWVIFGSSKSCHCRVLLT